jgi:ribosome modulation factor
MVEAVMGLLERIEFVPYPSRWRPYAEGMVARASDASPTTCPYRGLSHDWFEWVDGWKDLDERLAKMPKRAE